MLIDNAKFDRVIVVPIAVGSTSVADWADGNYAGRFPVAMRRLAASGITPATPGVSFAAVWGQGESDTEVGTSQASYKAGLDKVIETIFASGFSGRLFVNVETYRQGVISPEVQAAQRSVVNGTTIFQGANWDVFGSEDRKPDDAHSDDSSAPKFASTLYDAMHASGAPF
jgi:Carbohydrate esterase, sialic acid-specific acetylesterase